MEPGADEVSWPEPVEPLWLNRVVFDHQLLVLLGVVAVLACLVGLRFLGEPSFAARRPRIVFALELLLLPMLVIVVGTLVADAVRRLGPFEAREILDRARTIALYALSLWLLARALDLFLWRSWFVRRTGYVAPGLVRGLSYALLLLPVLALVLWWSGYSVTGVLLSTGVFAALVGLALQSTLGDLFSGIAISLEQPIRIGEWIELEDGTIGEVIDITWRSTRLQSFNSSELVVPNAKLAGQRIHNLSRPVRHYAAWYEVRLPPEILPRLATGLLLEAAARCRLVLKRPAPIVRLADAATRPYTYMVWVHYPTFLGSFRGREELFRAIDENLRRFGARTAVDIHEITVGRTRPVSVEPPTVEASLRSVDLFRTLDDNQIARLAAESRYVTVEAGEVLMRAGERVDAIHVLLVGVLEESLTQKDGREAVNQTLSPGASFGQISTVCSQAAIVTVTATTDSVLIRIEPATLKALVEANPKLYDAFAAIVAQRIEAVRKTQAAAAGRSAVMPKSLGEIRQRLERLFGARPPRTPPLRADPAR